MCQHPRRRGYSVDNRVIHRSGRPYKNIILFSYFFLIITERRTELGITMTDFLASLYPWTKALHVVSVISWMAGMFYLPRIFVYHAEQSEPGDSRDEVFQTMERKLLRLIINPAMIATWVFGLMLVFTPGIVDWAALWPYSKGAGIFGMTWFHHWLARRRKDFAAGENTRTGRQYRLMNEVPTVLMVVIVFSVILRF